MKTTESIASRAPSHAAANASPRPAGAAVPRLVLPPIALRRTALRRIAASRIVLHGLAAALLAGAAQTAHAGWTVTSLHPAGATHSRAMAVSGDVQVGVVNGRAALWRGTAASWVDLNPAGASSEAFGVYGDQQVGVVNGRAALWRGTAASWVDLHPAGAERSAATAVSGGVQAGWAAIPGHRASLWGGTAATRVDLHPPEWVGMSEILGASGDAQVGRTALYTGLPSDHRAALWRGSAASWVDLHPVGTGATHSEALAVSGDVQGGWARIGGNRRAGIWRGTAPSWVDLHPGGFYPESAVTGVAGDVQAGWTGFMDVRGRAGIWRGTAASWVDLHAFLPGGPDAWIASRALGVWTDGEVVRVVGRGTRAGTRVNEALLWTWTPPRFSGTLGLSGWAAPLAGRQVTFEVREPGSTTALRTAAAELSATGEFTFTFGFAAALPPGTYDVTAKGDRWLRARLQNVTFTAAGASGLDFGELIPGDVSENNAVDLTDFLFLAATYGASPPLIPTADLNGDGAVDLSDFLLLAANYETVGSP